MHRLADHALDGLDAAEIDGLQSHRAADSFARPAPMTKL
jgi:hypothetical protein